MLLNMVLFCGCMGDKHESTYDSGDTGNVGIIDTGVVLEPEQTVESPCDDIECGDNAYCDEEEVACVCEESVTLLPAVLSAHPQCLLSHPPVHSNNPTPL